MPDTRSLPARLLPWITWGLAVHILVIALLFGLLHAPIGLVRAIGAWKEAAIALLVVVVAIRAGAGRGPRARLGALDLCIGAWIALALVFFITEDVAWGAGLPLKATAYGVRDIAFFTIAYFIGRSTPEVGEDPRTLQRLFLILLFASSIAIVEWLFVSPEMLMLMGVGSYVQDFLGTGAFTTGNVYGLPDNYWTEMGGHMVRRAGSIFLSSQGFATPFLLFLPGATLWVFRENRRPSASLKIGYLIVWTGLVLSFTRSVIAVGVLQLLAIFLYKRKPTGAALVISAGTLMIVAGVVAFPGLATFVMETLTFQSGSSVSHLKDWSDGIAAFAQAPWGNGLGTTDQTAVRSGLEPLTADNQYLKYAVEMGIEGLLVHLGAMLLIGAAGYRLMRDGATAATRAFGATVALATFGILADGLTSVVFNNPIVAYLYFWFAGTAVTLADRLPRRAVAAADTLVPAHG